MMCMICLQGGCSKLAYPSDFDERDLELLKIMQDWFPVVERPFEEIGKMAGMEEDEVIERVRNLIERGAIRRLAVSIKHRNAGFRYNAMVVWNVDDELVEEVGKKVARFSEVTHCYERPRFPGWNYNLYAMIHGKSREECLEIIERISNEIGFRDYRIVWSIKEYKKTHVRI